MSVDDAIMILQDQIAYWEEWFTKYGSYPDDYSPELSDAMETVVEAIWKGDSMNSRNKGAVGERELARILREYGYNARRGQQYCGANGDADVVGLPGIHIEVKRVERLNISDAMAQSIGDAKPGEMPTVFHRKNCEPWKVTMFLDDWMKLYGNQRQEWIWCKDRLPKEPSDNTGNAEQMKEYIVFEEGARCATCVFYSGNGKWYADRKYCDVVAWMPLPSPPEEKP